VRKQAAMALGRIGEEAASTPRVSRIQRFPSLNHKACEWVESTVGEPYPPTAKFPLIGATGGNNNTGCASLALA
jgi:hypothetical protein